MSESRLSQTNLNSLKVHSTPEKSCELEGKCELIKTYDFYQSNRNSVTGKRACDYWIIALYKEFSSNDYWVGFWDGGKLIWLDGIGIKRNPEHTSYENINLRPRHISSYWTIEWTDWESLVEALQDEVRFLKEQDKK